MLLPSSAGWVAASRQARSYAPPMRCRLTAVDINGVRRTVVVVVVGEGRGGKRWLQSALLRASSLMLVVAVRKRVEPALYRTDDMGVIKFRPPLVRI